MITRLLLIAFLLCVGCSKQSNQEEMLKMLWDGDPAMKLTIDRVEVSDRTSFAVFTKATRADFADLRIRTRQFKVWTTVSTNTTIEIATKQLVAPRDFAGVYSVGESQNGRTKIAIWNEQKGELILVLATGLM